MYPAFRCACVRSGWMYSFGSTNRLKGRLGTKGNGEVSSCFRCGEVHGHANIDLTSGTYLGALRKCKVRLRPSLELRVRAGLSEEVDHFFACLQSSIS
eukprot:2372493-Amphidinium_carterae.2